jgi:hypothetical protein
MAERRREPGVGAVEPAAPAQDVGRGELRAGRAVRWTGLSNDAEVHGHRVASKMAGPRRNGSDRTCWVALRARSTS